MARIVNIRSVDRRENRTILSYDCEGQKYTFEIDGGAAEFRNYIMEQMPGTAENVAAIGLAHWLVNNPTSEDLSSLNGMAIKIDLAAGTLEVTNNG
jgi:hypothetical protein